MLVHSVFFWLKPDLTAAQRADFRRRIEALRAIESISEMHVGPPAATEDRGTIERGYDIGLTVLFKDLAAHDIYQPHPLHMDFIKQTAAYRVRVLVYDVQTA